MAKQGQRYDEKTKTGWKFENGRSNYYVKGKKLSTKQVISRGLKPLTDTARKIVEPLTIGAKNIASGNVSWRRHPNSTTGESVLAYNTRIAKEQLKIQTDLDKNPNVIKNETDRKNLSASEFFGTGEFGDKDTQIANTRTIDNLQISKAYREKNDSDPWAVGNLPGTEIARSNAGTGYTTDMPDLTQTTPTNDLGQNKNVKSELAIDKPKKYNQKLLDAGFKTTELDDLKIQHDSWKAARASGTLGDWEAKHFPDRTPRYKNKKKKNKNKKKP